MKSFIALAIQATISVSALAQTTLPTEYPADSKPVLGDELKSLLSGRVFTVKTVRDGDWRLEFKDNGYAFLDTAGGYRDSGKWWVEAGKWCVHLSKGSEACSDMRSIGSTHYYKRASNLEIVSMTLR